MCGVAVCCVCCGFVLWCGLTCVVCVGGYRRVTYQALRVRRDGIKTNATALYWDEALGGNAVRIVLLE